MLRAVMAFLCAVAGAYVLGSVLATQVILARIDAMGLPITLRDRLDATAHDVVGLAGSYLPLIALAFLVALPLAAWLGRYLPRGRVLLYGLAGALAVVTIHVAIRLVLGLNGIAAVRDPHGMALQALAGCFGGYLFFVFTGQAHRRSPPPSAPTRV
jgi:hypothetical protein